MRYGIVAVVLSFVALFANAQQESAATHATDTIKLRAKVMAIHQLEEVSGTVVPVDFDPRFALTLRIETVVPPVAELMPDAEVTFAIHSPALAFSGDPKRGTTYNLVLCRRIVNGKPKFFGFGVQLKGGSLGKCE